MLYTHLLLNRRCIRYLQIQIMNFLCLLGTFNVVEFLHLNSCCHEIHLTLSFWCNATTLSSWDLLYDAKVLKSVKSMADDSSSSLGVMLGAGRVLSITSSKGTTEGSNSNSMSSIHSAGYSSSLYKIPVLILWTKLLEASSFAKVNISRKLNLH